MSVKNYRSLICITGKKVLASVSSFGWQHFQFCTEILLDLLFLSKVWVFREETKFDPTWGTNRSLTPTSLHMGFPIES
jgi:hypothetical protein